MGLMVVLGVAAAMVGLVAVMAGLVTAMAVVAEMAVLAVDAEQRQT